MRKNQKENSIIKSALKMFATQGFYCTSISQIAKSVGISVGNIYNYFPSKNCLAKASITFVTKKLALDLRYINNKKINTKEKLSLFVVSYLNFVKEHPDRIDYFFRVYLANREMFCEEEDCGFKLAKDFIDEIQRLIDDGVKNNEFIEQDFVITFSCITGILGGITFLNGENVLENDLQSYANELSNIIYKTLS